MDLTTRASALRDQIVTLRRKLHASPETGIDTVWTANQIADELDKLGVAYTRLPSNQIVARIGRGSAPAIALRADMDGLPVVEETELPFASTNGAMHACGHDGHTAMLLGTAQGRVPGMV